MEVFQVVQSMPRSMLYINGLMEVCFRKRNGFGGLSQDVVERRREERRKEARQGRTMTADAVAGGGGNGGAGVGAGAGAGKKLGLGRTKSRGRFARKIKGPPLPPSGT